MKKIISLFMVIIMLVSFAACADTSSGETTGTTAASQSTTAPVPVVPDSESAVVLAGNAIDAFWASNSFKADVSAVLNMSYSGMSYSETFEKEVFASDLNTAPVWNSISYTTSYGETQVSKTYFENDTYYVSKYGFDGKISRSDEADEAYGYKKTIDVFLKKIPTPNLSTNKGEYVTDVEMSDDGYLTIYADTAKKTVMFSEYMDFIKETLLGSDYGEGVNVYIDDPTEKVSVVLDANGNLSEYTATIVFDIVLSYQGVSQAVSISADVAIDVEKLNEELNVTKPEKSLDSFVSTTAEDFNYTFASVAYEEFLNKKDIDAEVSSDIILSMDTGVRMEINLSGTFIGKDYLGKTPVWREYAQLTMGSTQEEVDIYFCDGYYYINAGGVKMKLSEEEYRAQYGDDDDSNELFEFFDKSAVVLSEAYMDSKTGTRELYFELNEEKFKSIFADDIEAIQSIVMGEYEVSKTEIYYPYVDLYISAGGDIEEYFVEYYAEFTAVVEGKEITVLAYVSDDVYIHQIEEEITVPVPSDLDSYVSENV